jgi:hypothetical protein
MELSIVQLFAIGIVVALGLYALTLVWTRLR